MKNASLSKFDCICLRASLEMFKDSINHELLKQQLIIIVLVAILSGGTLNYSLLPDVMHSLVAITYDSLKDITNLPEHAAIVNNY